MIKIQILLTKLLFCGYVKFYSMPVFYKKEKKKLLKFYENLSRREIAFVLLFLKKSKLISKYSRIVFKNDSFLYKHIVWKNYNNIDTYNLTKKVILVSHFGVIEAIPFILEKFIENKSLLIVRNKNADFLSFFKENNKVSIFSLNDSEDNVYTAIDNTLKNNGNIVIFADGFYGKHEIVLPFLNKYRGFKVGFAKITYLYNLEAIPIFVSFADNFTININIEKPLFIEEQISEHDSIYNLILQYSRLLEYYWLKNPEYVLLNQRIRYGQMKGAECI